MFCSVKLSFGILVGTSLAGLLFVGFWLKKKHRYSFVRTKGNNTLPKRWKNVGKVSGLTIFPLKSAKGISLEKAGFTSLGIVDVGNAHIKLQDREFIIYDDCRKTAVTGLVNPRVVLIELRAENESTIRFSFPDHQDFLLKIPVDITEPIVLQRWWGETVQAVDCGEPAANWISECLGDSLSHSNLRLGHFSRPIVPLRSLDNGWTHFARVYDRMRSEYLGAYSYLASYLIITEESVVELSRTVGKPICESRFRANVIVRGVSAFSEDGWDWLRLGESVVLRGFKPCTRCAVTAINPETGKLDSDLEPLRSLKKFRQLTNAEERKLSGSEPVFGLYAGLHTPGNVVVGDPVYIAQEDT